MSIPSQSKISCKNLTILERLHLSNIFTPMIKGFGKVVNTSNYKIFTSEANKTNIFHALISCLKPVAYQLYNLSMSMPDINTNTNCLYLVNLKIS